MVWPFFPWNVVHLYVPQVLYLSAWLGLISVTLFPRYCKNMWAKGLASDRKKGQKDHNSSLGNIMPTNCYCSSWSLTLNIAQSVETVVQIPIKSTFYSYFREFFSGEYHIYQFIPLHSCYYLKNISIKINVVTD